MADVIYLDALYRLAFDKLQTRGWLDAVYEESSRFAGELLAQSDPARYYLKVRGGWMLSPARQLGLQALCQWREERSRELDRPRNKVIPDKVLLAVVEANPKTLGDLTDIEGFLPVMIRKHGEAMMEILQSAGETPVPEDFELIAAPLSREEKPVYQAIKALITRAAERADVPVELIAPKRRLEPAIREGLRTGEIPGIFREGWRGTLLAEELNEMTERLQA